MTTETPKPSLSLWRHRHFYLFIAPFFLIFAVFGLYPLLFSLYLSFVKWDGLTQIHWAGLSNFQKMAHDDQLWTALSNTVVIGLLYVPPMMILAFVFAQLLNAPWLKFKSLYRAAFFIPCVTPMAVIAFVFQLIFSSEHGVLNYALQHLFPFLHLTPIPWLESEGWSKAAIAILVVWRWTGYNMVLMLAGLQGIPGDYYEAAELDGASKIQQMIHITLPLLKPTLAFCGLLSLLGTLYMFDEIFVMTNGGPGSSSTNFGMYLFQISFDDFRLGYASCVAYSVALIVVLATMLMNRMNRKNVEAGLR
ncbi:sugar ABC transporter permease [Capsulimonas corticalis]|uniref:Sugar ABC transporter permease n=1 Tax=Capsulimonas corticalis TaxID=2219043 RepID=A0A402CVI5_9BACT|nr:sugar ABC transporter permease [Capsulimonas corticalis]BDI30413.1 sugar ABC transporter permease [Capsulimonas corticalis]